MIKTTRVRLKDIDIHPLCLPIFKAVLISPFGKVQRPPGTDDKTWIQQVQLRLQLRPVIAVRDESRWLAICNPIGFFLMAELPRNTYVSILHAPDIIDDDTAIAWMMEDLLADWMLISTERAFEAIGKIFEVVVRSQRWSQPPRSRRQLAEQLGRSYATLFPPGRSILDQKEKSARIQMKIVPDDLKE